MDSLKSIWEDLNDRLKSPFIISFVLSWLAWNWEILYAANNFGADYSMFDRLWYIKLYVSENLCSKLSFYPFVTSFLAALVFYISKSLYLGLDSFYENRLRVSVIKVIGISKMVPVADLEKYVKEIELERKERREQEAIHATLRSEKENLLAEIEGMKVENSNYHILDRKNIELREQNEQLTNKLRSNEVEFPRDLTIFFGGHWVFEYQVSDADKNVITELEIFLISDVEFRVDGKTLYTAEHITWFKGMGFLAFTKKKVGRQINHNRVRLQKQSDNLWIGMEERDNSSTAYIRLYPIGILPVDYMVILNAAKAEQPFPQGQTYKDDKFSQLNALREKVKNFTV